MSREAQVPDKTEEGLARHSHTQVRPLTRALLSFPGQKLVFSHPTSQAVLQGQQRQWQQRAVPRPDQQDLDILTLLDLTTVPTGDLVREHDRIAEILTRYEPGHPVHTAVTASTPELLASAARARTILDLATTLDKANNLGCPL